METTKEMTFTELESNKHFNNIMYGVWEERKKKLFYY